MNSTSKTDNYFFCYALELRHKLKRRGFSYVCTGLHPKTKRQFWLFERTPELNDVLDSLD